MIANLKPSAEQQISGMLFAVLLLDADLTIAQANHAAEDMLGRSRKRLKGMNLAEACGIAVPVVERMAQAENQLVARGVSITPMGRERIVNLTVSPLASNPPWRVVTISDAGQNAMRNDSDGQTALMAPAILAHEIKNPLAAIKGASQLLDRSLDERGRQLTGMIANEVGRIARLVDRMQALGSKTGEKPQPVNVHQIVRKAIASVRTATKAGIDLSEEFDPSLPQVLANPDALAQVLVNLLSNAADACGDQDNAQIAVRTRFVSGLTMKEGNGDHPVSLPIEITVCDNGPGITSELADHVFEPFVTSKRNGQGLGLALVKKFVTDMGGRISHRRSDARTEFRIHLAVAR